MLSIVAVLSVGCAASRPPATTQAIAPPMTTSIAQCDEGESSAAALAFDPPVLAGEAPLALAREPRERSAFMGYDQTTTTFSYIRIDDRQTGDEFDRYERRALIERVGVSTR